MKPSILPFKCYNFDMSSDAFYKKELFICQVDKDDKIIGPVERWKAHRENILHRAISVVVYYEDKVFVQHRKHPLFDGYFDITIASHQFFENGKAQDDISSVYQNLLREWNVTRNDLKKDPEFIGKIYYMSPDWDTEFHEQEFDYFYKVDLKDMKLPIMDYCYGFSLLPLDEIKKGKHGILPHVTPWTKKAIEDGVL
ncbi:MAG: hypothetical protein U0525_02905 [Patescibacteria group bacterium]